MKFLRRVWFRHKKIGKGRKKKQVWRRPRGRDNKMREKRKGRSPSVSVGYKKQKERKKEVLVYNLKDLSRAKASDLVILGKVGKKKKLEIAKKAKEMKIKFQNLNLKKFLKQNESK
jgi:large subunit ribosomal protein L32e